MKERPILFSAPMVRAILAGEKTQTRRIVKPQPVPIPAHVFKDPKVPAERQFWWPSNVARSMLEVRDMSGLSPYGRAGDRLWVKETHQYADWTEDGMPWIRYAADSAERFHDSGSIPDSWDEKLTDIWAELSGQRNVSIDGKAADRAWRPSIHMPRWASRITLEITSVRVERLQDISNDDAIAEGVATWRDGWTAAEQATAFVRGTEARIKCGDLSTTAQRLYYLLWSEINGVGSWDANPWVWVVEFKQVQP